MTWKGNQPQIHLIEETYEKGITVKSSDKGRSLTRFDVQEFYHPPDRAIYLDGCAAPKVVTRNHEMLFRPRKINIPFYILAVPKKTFLWELV